MLKNKAVIIKPSSISHLRGNHKIVKQLKVALDYTDVSGNRFPNSLFTGNVSHSCFARVISQEMSEPIVFQHGNYFNVPQINNLLLENENDRLILFISQAESLTEHSQIVLAKAINEGFVSILEGKRNSEIPITPFTLILSTHSENYLTLPIRNAMQLECHFEYYKETEIFQILFQLATANEIEVQKDVLSSVARICRGSSTKAFKLLTYLHRICRGNCDQKIDIHHFNKLIQIEEVDPLLGLTQLEIKYLNLLSNQNESLQNIADELIMPTFLVSANIEPDLSRLELIKINNNRRSLTPKGMELLREISS